MPFSKIEKLKLGFIKHWPLNNKLRLARWLVPEAKNGKPAVFEGVSFLNEHSLLYTDTNNYLEYSVFTTGTYETHIANLIKSQIREGDVVFDIGANIGIHTITMSQSAGKNGKVYAFEPIAFLGERLKKNIWINNIDNVEVVPYALSDEAATTKVFFDENQQNLGTVSLANDAYKRNYSIEVRKGDDLVNEYQIEKINFIKIDVEGLEIKVLMGLKHAIQRFRPRIIFEYDQHYLQRTNDKGTDLQERLFNFFHQWKYQLYNIEPEGMRSIPNKSAFPSSGNIFAIPE